MTGEINSITVLFEKAEAFTLPDQRVEVRLAGTAAEVARKLQDAADTIRTVYLLDKR